MIFISLIFTQSNSRMSEHESSTQMSASKKLFYPRTPTAKPNIQVSLTDETESGQSVFVHLFKNPASTLILFNVKGPPIAHGEPRGIWLKEQIGQGSSRVRTQNLKPEHFNSVDTVSTGDHRCLSSLSARKSFFAFVLFFERFFSTSSWGTT